ncbi:MAG: hypothetical protein FWB93_04160 [Oscillospiraceae bacterium]|nr:hypothetical protein [Oscillospiraceae bacterium]
MKKLATLTIAILMLFALLAGCGDEGNESYLPENEDYNEDYWHGNTNCPVCGWCDCECPAPCGGERCNPNICVCRDTQPEHDPLAAYPRPTFALPAPAPAQPPRQGAIIVPEQGGAMLFPFPAPQPFAHLPSAYDGRLIPYFLQGLVNDIGEVITQPRYDRTQTITDRFGHVLSILAWRNEVVVQYDLYGNVSELPFTARRIEPAADGRFWIVWGVGLQSPFQGWYQNNSLEQVGIWCVETGEFVFAPMDGINFVYSNRLFLGVEYTQDGNNSFVRGFYWCYVSDTSRDFPYPWQAHVFLPYQGVFSASMRGQRLSVRFIDWNMNFSNEEPKTHLSNFQNLESVGSLFITRSNAHNFLLPYRLFDSGGNLVFETDFGSLITFREITTGDIFVAYLDIVTMQINALWDAVTGLTVDISEVDSLKFENLFYIENGEWKRLYFDCIVKEHIDNPEQLFISMPIFVSKNAIVLQVQTIVDYILGACGYILGTSAIAIDWRGDIIEHPLEQFLTDHILLHPVEHATHDLFWVTERDGRRLGIINSQGEWLLRVE